ncbi:unnamed protein product, partial [Musa banksii]
DASVELNFTYQTTGGSTQEHEKHQQLKNEGKRTKWDRTKVETTFTVIGRGIGRIGNSIVCDIGHHRKRGSDRNPHRSPPPRLPSTVGAMLLDDPRPRRLGIAAGIGRSVWNLQAERLRFSLSFRMENKRKTGFPTKSATRRIVRATALSSFSLPFSFHRNAKRGRRALRLGTGGVLA